MIHYFVILYVNGILCKNNKTRYHCNKLILFNKNFYKIMNAIYKVFFLHVLFSS